MLTDSSNRDSVAESSLPVPPPPGDIGQPSELSLVLDSAERALQRLISGTIPQGELASPIETIFSSERATDIVGCLGEGDAQTFIDVVYEVGYHSFILGERVNWFDCRLFLRFDRRWRPSILHERSEGNA